jgi:hypothetical protein
MTIESAEVSLNFCRATIIKPINRQGNWIALRSELIRGREMYLYNDLFTEARVLQVAEAAQS